MYELKKIGIASAARVGIFLGVAGYLLFTAIAVGSGAVKFTVQTGLLTLAVGVALAVIFGFIMGALLAWIYNILSHAWGGLYLDFHLIDDDDKDNPVHHDSAPGNS